MKNDEFDAKRFIDAQKNSYDMALAEIKSGRKQSHWMWYIFPQLKGLGKSGTSDFYGLNGLKDAKAYIEDPILGVRLLEISRAVLDHNEKTAEEIFGYIDAKKLKSCMTLFKEAAPELQIFNDVLKQFYNGRSDYRTLHLLGR